MSRFKSLRKTSVGKKTKKSAKKSPTCKQRLSEKIAININEMKDGRYVSRAQAIAVAYKQIAKEFPHCKRFISASAVPSARRRVKKSH
jgi:hypothetical protein